jgi:hypothetical protein
VRVVASDKVPVADLLCTKKVDVSPKGGRPTVKRRGVEAQWQSGSEKESNSEDVSFSLQRLLLRKIQSASSSSGLSKELPSNPLGGE